MSTPRFKSLSDFQASMYTNGSLDPAKCRAAVVRITGKNADGSPAFERDSNGQPVPVVGALTELQRKVDEYKERVEWLMSDVLPNLPVGSTSSTAGISNEVLKREAREIRKVSPSIKARDAAKSIAKSHDLSSDDAIDVMAYIIGAWPKL